MKLKSDTALVKLVNFLDPFSCHFLTNYLLFLPPFSIFLYKCCSPRWLAAPGFHSLDMSKACFSGHLPSNDEHIILYDIAEERGAIQSFSSQVIFLLLIHHIQTTWFSSFGVVLHIFCLKNADILQLSPFVIHSTDSLPALPWKLKIYKKVGIPKRGWKLI